MRRSMRNSHVPIIRLGAGVLIVALFNGPAHESAVVRAQLVDSQLMERLDRRIYQDHGVLDLPEYRVAITAVFDGATKKEESKQCADLLFLSLARDTEVKRHEVGREFAKRCDAVLTDASQALMAKELAVLIQCCQFDHPKDGVERENEFWRNMNGNRNELRKACLIALSVVPWLSDASIEVREENLLKWFVEANSEETRLGILGCISSAVGAHKCDPLDGVRIFESIVDTGTASKTHVQAMLSQIKEWIGDLQLQLLFATKRRQGKTGDTSSEPKQ